MIQKVFLHPDWEKTDIARRDRDRQAVAFEQQGWLCRCLTLYRVTDGLPVFLLEADEPESESASTRKTIRRSPRRTPTSRSKSR